jgi:TonB family protein
MELFKYEAAKTLLDTSLTIRGEVSGQQSAAYAAGLVKLGELSAKRRLPSEADYFFAKAASLGDRPEIVKALLHLGIKAHREKNTEAANDFLQRVVNLAPASPEAGQALTWMGLMRKTELDAEQFYQRALNILDRESPETATALELYAQFLRTHERTVEAEEQAARARGIRMKYASAGVSTRLSIDGNTTPGGGVFRVGGGVTPPALISKIEPSYSEEARAAKYQGTVLLYVEVDPDGYARNIRVARSLGLGLDEEAVEAVRRWRFRPGTKEGNPVTVAATIEVNFRLK